jgi:hypothetical protein
MPHSMHCANQFGALQRLKQRPAASANAASSIGPPRAAPVYFAV